jgi:hypothetical protein
MLELCTMLDAHFVLRGMALLRSLERQGAQFRLWMLCTDDASYELFARLDLPSVVPFHLSELEQRFPALPQVKSSRGPYEYIATAKPFLLRYVMEKISEGTVLWYLDADLCFFADPKLMERELGDADLLLTPHHFANHLESKAANNGFFNAGFLGARNSADGRKAIDWWCDKCLEWCYDRVENGKSSNQKYLEAFPTLVSKAKVAEHPGLNVAPWNVDRFTFKHHGKRVTVTPCGKTDGLRNEESPLVFYHFHALKFPRTWLADTSLALYHMKGNGVLARHVYGLYFRELKAVARWLKQHGFSAGMGSVRHGTARSTFSPGLLASRVRKRQWLIVLRGMIV